MFEAGQSRAVARDRTKRAFNLTHICPLARCSAAAIYHSVHLKVVGGGETADDVTTFIIRGQAEQLVVAAACLMHTIHSLAQPPSL